jgi:hypothetical protein
LPGQVESTSVDLADEHVVRRRETTAFAFDSLVEKDVQVQEMHRENHLLRSKIELLEHQMDTVNNRIYRTLRERHRHAQDTSGTCSDSNVSLGVAQ